MGSSRFWLKLQKKKANLFRMIFPDSHYDNTPMLYTAIFHSCKNGNFQMKNYYDLFFFVRNIVCGSTLEPPHRVPTIYVLEQI